MFSCPVFFRLPTQMLALLELSVTISVMNLTSKQQNFMHMNLNDYFYHLFAFS